MCVHGAALAGYLRDIWKHRHVVRHFVYTNLRSGNRDKLLGNLWSLLDPLLMMLVFFVVFGVLLRRGVDPIEYLPFLLVGIVAWRFSQTVATGAGNSLRGARGLVHEIAFPKAAIPVSVVLARGYDFMCGLLILAVMLIILGSGFKLSILWLPLVILVHSLFNLGVALLFSVIGAFFADISNVLSFVYRLLFYLSPVFYEISLVPEKLQPIYMINPYSALIEAYRDVLLRGLAPDPVYFGYAAGLSLALCILGILIFNRAEGVIAKYV